jgi:hypothetical protein
MPVGQELGGRCLFWVILHRRAAKSGWKPKICPQQARFSVDGRAEP